MKRWPLVVALLYAAILGVLAFPLLAAAGGRWPDASLRREFFGGPVFWIGLAVLALCQLGLLLIPVRIATRRPVTPGALWPTLLLGALLLAVLVVAAVLSFSAAAFGDGDGLLATPWLLFVLFGASWLLWTLVFRRLARAQAPADFVATLCTRLVRGSILELLVAVPCHIVVRQRQTCCAGLLTAFGLGCGIAVMLAAFGPALYYLFVARARRLRPSS